MIPYVKLLINFLLGLIFAFISLIGLTVGCVLLLIFYCSFRLIWLFSGAAAIERSKRRFKNQSQKLLQQFRKKRSNYARAANHKDMVELLEEIDQQLQHHQQLLDAELVDELHYLLDRYQQSFNFDKTLYIHTIVTTTDASSLNTTLSKLLNDDSALDWSYSYDQRSFL